MDEIIKNRDSAVIYRSFYEAIRDLPTIEQQGEVWNAIFELAFNGIEIKLIGISNTLFTLIKPQIKANLEKFKNGKAEKRPRTVSKLQAKVKQTVSNAYNANSEHKMAKNIPQNRLTTSKSEANCKQTTSKSEANVNVNEECIMSNVNNNSSSSSILEENIDKNETSTAQDTQELQEWKNSEARRKLESKVLLQKQNSNSQNSSTTFISMNDCLPKIDSSAKKAHTEIVDYFNQLTNQSIYQSGSSRVTICNYIDALLQSGDTIDDIKLLIDHRTNNPNTKSRELTAWIKPEYAGRNMGNAKAWLNEGRPKIEKHEIADKPKSTTEIIKNCNSQDFNGTF